MSIERRGELYKIRTKDGYSLVASSKVEGTTREVMAVSDIAEYGGSEDADLCIKKIQIRKTD